MGSYPVCVKEHAHQQIVVSLNGSACKVNSHNATGDLESSVQIL